MRIRAVICVGFLVLSHSASAVLGFGTLSALNSNATTDAGEDYYLALTTDNAGHWSAVWVSSDSLGNTIGTDQDILYAYSDDDGDTWSDPDTLNVFAASDGTGSDSLPVVVTDGSGHWTTLWQSNADIGGLGTDSDIVIARSDDNGESWTNQVALNTNATTDTGADLGPTLATDRIGHWVAAWESTDSLGTTIGTDGDVLVSRSTNAGVTWTAPVALNTTAATDGTAHDGIPAIATDRAGVWVAVWNSDVELNDTTDLDIYFARSTDNGMTWSDPLPLNSNAAMDAGDDGAVRIATDTQGNWVVVWRSTDSLGGTVGGDYDIFVAHSTDDAETWSAVKALNSNAKTDSGDDFEPVVVSDDTGNWITVWESDDTLGMTVGSDKDALISRSTDNGATWSAVKPMNSNAAADSGADFFVTIATDTMGRWIGGWSTNDSLGNTIGTDTDLVTAISDQLSNGSLLLLAPNGGENWQIGKKKRIEWTSTGDPGVNVKLELLRDGGVVSIIKNSTGNDGAQKWKLPPGLTPGKRYKVRVTSTSEGSISDLSDKGFRIKPAK